MKTTLHTTLLYPLVLIFSAFLKGKKTEYRKFFNFNNEKSTTKEEILQVRSIEYNFYDNIKLFFDKQSALYDKTLIIFELNLNKHPEDKKNFAFDFFRIINIYYTLSMLSARVTNKNIDLEFICEEKNINDEQINNFLRYSFLTYASKKVDTLTINKKILNNEKILKAHTTMQSHLNDSEIINFSNSKNLYVLTCKQNKKTFDIIWSSNEDIELTEFNKVYDKYGTQLTKDIKISTSPIYAFHK